MWESLLNFMGGYQQDDPDLLAANHVSDILISNADKNFVQRIMKPDFSPTMELPQGQGSWGTHLMSSGELSSGEGIAYPNIIQLPNGNLQQLSGREAMNYAMKNNEHIKFKTPQEAEWFGKNYKRVWGQH